MKKQKYLIFVVFCLLLLPFGVKAQSGGGQGTGGSSQSGSYVGDQPDNIEIGDVYGDTFSAYRMRVVYVDSNFNWRTLKTVVAYAPETCNNTGCDHKQELVNEYVNSHPGYVYKSSGILANWAKNITSDHSYIDKTYGVKDKTKGWESSKLAQGDVVKKIIVDSEGFGVPLSQLQEDNPVRLRDDFNSYGYRIIIERLFILTSHDHYHSSPFFGYLSTRRENIAANGSYTVGGSATWDLYTSENDLRMHYVDRNGGLKTFQFIDKYGNDYGGGYNILWFSTDGNKDRSLDMACENCDSKISDSRAIVLQDTNNWKAIESSNKLSSTTSSECKNNVKNHFYKMNDKVYCREEYHVYYPNANNKIKVYLGRFFTVNADNSILKTIEDGLIPNLAPIKVTKIRTCKGSDGDLEAFRKSSDSNFSKCGGEIILNYKEKKSGGYSLNNEKLKGTLDNFNSYVSGGVLEQKATFNYTLRDNVFRYIRLRDGYSVSTKPNEPYRDVKVSNIPVSMGIKIPNDKKIADLKFRYSLPNESSSCTDPNSDMYNAYRNSGSKNDYLNCANSKSGKLENIYKKYTQGKTDDDESINDSACVKLYGSDGLGKNGSDVMKCINDRTSNKMADCFDKNKDNNYACDIAVQDCTKETAGKKPFENSVWVEDKKECVAKCSRVDGDYYDNNGKKVDKNTYENVCCNSSNHDEMGRDWDKNNNKCCASGTVWAEKSNKCCVSDDYNPNDGTCGGKPKTCTKNTAGTGNFANKVWSDVDGKCCNKDQYENGRCCNSDNYQELGRDWNDNEGICCPAGQKYNANNKKCELPPADKCKVNNLSCGDKPCCTDCHGKGYCGKGSVSKGTDYCPGKPCAITTCKEDNCDYMKEVATYRVIDPSQPFVAQSGGATRQTGENWCSEPASGNHVCSGSSDNSVVKKVVSDKTNVTEDKAMYTVKLNSNTINAIRQYNDRNGYDDFNFECNSDGQMCRSKFLNNTIRSAVDTTKSSCFGVGNSNFDTCG